VLEFERDSVANHWCSPEALYVQSAGSAEESAVEQALRTPVVADPAAR